jgi:hypothetical protein
MSKFSDTQWCVCVYFCTHTHTYVHTYVYTYTHTITNTHTHMHMHMHMKTYSRVVYAQMSRQSRTATLQAKMKETSVRKMHSVTVRSWVSSDIRTTKEKKKEKKNMHSVR